MGEGEGAEEVRRERTGGVGVHAPLDADGGDVDLVLEEDLDESSD